MVDGHLDGPRAWRCATGYAGSGPVDRLEEQGRGVLPVRGSRLHAKPAADRAATRFRLPAGHADRAARTNGVSDDSWSWASNPFCHSTTHRPAVVRIATVQKPGMPPVCPYATGPVPNS